MRLTRKLGIAATLAGIMTIGCGLAMTPRALAAPKDYGVTGRYKNFEGSFQNPRYGDRDHRAAKDHRRFDRVRDDRRFAHGDGPAYVPFARDYHRDRHDHFRHRRFRHYWR